MRGSRVPCSYFGPNKTRCRIPSSFCSECHTIYSYIIYVWNICTYKIVYIYIYATCSYSLDSLASHIANLSLRSLHTLPERQEIYTQSLESDWNIRNEGSFSHLHCFRLSFGRIQPRRVRMRHRQMRVRSDAVMHKVGTRRGRKMKMTSRHLGKFSSVWRSERGLTAWRLYWLDGFLLSG